MRLDELKPAEGSKRKRKRVGRGDGSGHGTYCGRGGKGQTARSGYRMVPGFEGGQTPLWKRVPKRGFNNPMRRQYAYVNLDTLNEKYKDGEEVNPQNLIERGLIKETKDGVKILGKGRLKLKLSIKAHRFSKKALAKIAEAGGIAISLDKRPRDYPSAKQRCIEHAGKCT